MAELQDSEIPVILYASVILPSAGSNGYCILPNYPYTRSVSPAGYCSTLLPAGLLYFKATANQNKGWCNGE
jgi:hypothetical protein